jgi:hypothetical protein
MNYESQRISKEVVMPNRGTILKFSWKDWRKPERTSVRIAGVAAEFRKEHLSNTSLGCYLNNLVLLGNNTIYVLFVFQFYLPDNSRLLRNTSYSAPDP